MDDTSYKITSHPHAHCIQCEQGRTNPGGFQGNNLQDDRTWRDPSDIAQRHAAVQSKGNRSIRRYDDGGSGMSLENFALERLESKMGRDISPPLGTNILAPVALALAA